MGDLIQMSNVTGHFKNVGSTMTCPVYTISIGIGIGLLLRVYHTSFNWFSIMSE
jgi:hypothetical protein